MLVGDFTINTVGLAYALHIEVGRQHPYYTVNRILL